MDKKKYGILIGITALFMLLLIVLTISLISNKKAEKIPEISEISSATVQTTVIQTSTTTETTTAAPLYIVGEWEGKLAVYTLPKTNTPYKAYDVLISSLPTEEQQRLKNGIYVYTDQQLQRLLEDYTS